MKKVILMLLAMASIGVYAELTPVKVQKLWGLQDETGTMVVAPTYTSIGEFSSQYTWVNKGGKCLYGQFPVSGKWGVIDDEGNEVCPVEYEYVDLCYGDYVNVNRGGVIDSKNRTISGGLWGIYDLVNKKEVVPCVYTQLGPVNSNGVCWAQKEGSGKRHLVIIEDKNDKGKVTNLRYNFIYYPSLRYRDILLDQNGVWGLVTADGTEITPFHFTKVNNFSDEFSVVAIAQLYGVVNSHGVQVIPCVYRDITNPGPWGVCWAKENNKYALVSIKNQVLTEFKYDSINDFSEGKSWVKEGDLFGLVDTAGTEIVAPRYQNVFPFYNGFAAVLVDGKVGMINTDGKETIPPLYASTIIEFGDNQFRPVDFHSPECIHPFCKLNNTFDWFNMKGEVLVTNTKGMFGVKDIIPNALWNY